MTTRTGQDHRLRWRALLIASVILFLGFSVSGFSVSGFSVLGFPVAAAAQDSLDCSQPVVDTSDEVDVDRVIAAISDVNPEATIVVRVYDQVPDANLTAVIDDVVATCFGDEATGVRSDVVVLGVSVGDRLSDVLVGPRWGAAVAEPDRIRNEVMGDLFRQGDFTGGLIAAIEEVGEGVDTQLAQGGLSGADDTAGEASETPNIVPVDAGDDGRSPWAIGGGAAAVALGGGAFLAINRQRKLTTARNDLTTATEGPLARLGSLRERDTRLDIQADGWEKTSAGATKVALSKVRRDAVEAKAETDRARALLGRATPDGAAKAKLHELERARQLVLELSRALDSQDEALDRLAAFGAHLDHLRVALPAKVELLQEEVVESKELAEQRDSEGWIVADPTAALSKVAETIEGLPFDVLEVDLLRLSDRVEQAEASLFATNHYLQSLPSRVGSLKEWTAGLEAAADLELRRIDELRRQFVSLAAHHASDSWQWAVDLPEQAMDYLHQADQLQEKVITELISRQEFDVAGRELERAGMLLISADALLDQVDDLIVDLEKALEEAPGMVRNSRVVLHDLASFVAAHHGDVAPDIAAAPDALAGAIAGLDQELRQIKPNYLRVAETADRINRQLDQSLAAAQEQHLRMETLRRELAREVDRARRAIARTRRSIGWEFFESRDSSDLDELEQDLRSLPSDVERAIDEVAEVADDALRIQERVIARRRRSGTWISTGGGGFGSGRSGSGGGWSSGGSGSGGFGGGRSFGGGGSAGGGRSFGGGRSSGSF